MQRPIVAPPPRVGRGLGCGWLCCSSPRRPFDPPSICHRATKPHPGPPLSTSTTHPNSVPSFTDPRPINLSLQLTTAALTTALSGEADHLPDAPMNPSRAARHIRPARSRRGLLLPLPSSHLLSHPPARPLPRLSLLSAGPHRLLSTSSRSVPTTPWRPSGYPVAVPSISVEGAREAIDFYQRAFGAEVEHCITHPAQGKVMHATLRLGDGVLFVSDTFEEWGSRPSVVGLRVYVPDVDEAFKRAVDAGATVLQEPAESATTTPQPARTPLTSHISSVDERLLTLSCVLCAVCACEQSVVG